MWVCAKIIICGTYERCRIIHMHAPRERERVRGKRPFRHIITRQRDEMRRCVFSVLIIMLNSCLEWKCRHFYICVWVLSSFASHLVYFRYEHQNVEDPFGNSTDWEKATRSGRQWVKREQNTVHVRRFYRRIVASLMYFDLVMLSLSRQHKNRTVCLTLE